MYEIHSLFIVKAKEQSKRTMGNRHGGVAQLGEHLPCKQGVMGSNPIISITQVKRKTDRLDRTSTRSEARKHTKDPKAKRETKLVKPR